MHQQHILVVDDNQEIRDLLSDYLQRHGYRVSVVADGAMMRERLTKDRFDLIVLDIMMPGEDGLSLCRHVQQTGGPPVIMLTAMAEDTDCVVGLEMGADDYVAKPFVPRVLLARIKAVLRRNPEDRQPKTTEPVAEQRRFLDWQLDIHQRQLARKDGLLVPLSNAEFVLLQVFLDNPKKVMSRDQLLTATKGRQADPFDRSIDNQVSRLRKKIETNSQQPQLIKTVWGGGYLFTASVS
ncbi:MAG: DNA-binding response regulator [Gammaproteobacteria bacterium]|nr:MAG: DNA-binding response regulator [Gammaproteobacteria bacterium]